MFSFHLTFGAPAYLLLLALVPCLWWWSFRRLAALGPSRRLAALILRSLVVTLLALALAEPRMCRISDRLTVVYLLDQSLSIPESKRQAMVEYVNREVERHRREKDRAGVIVFGRDAAIEVPPFDDNVLVPSTTESQFDPNYTNLAAAMRLAQAAFPEDAAKRIVVVTDGNQNQGNALEEAQALAASGIGIDVVPIRYRVPAEVSVERIVLPADIRRDDPFDVRIVLNNNAEPRPGEKGEVRGLLRLSQLIDERSKVLHEERVTLPPGKKVYSFRQEIHEPSFYTYEARFIPDRAQDDAMAQNNRATAFTHVQGEGQVLLIEDVENRGEQNGLVESLEQRGLEVTRRNTGQLFSSLAELQAYDTVVLANVPRAASDDPEKIFFSDEQISMLVRNTQQMGCGLVMLGGPNSFGAGGWTGTELEKAMPVDFEIKNAEVAPRGALVMIMHASEMATGNHAQKVIAKEAIKALSAQDYCGIIHWDGSGQWILGNGLVQLAKSRSRLLAAVDRMVPGDMPDFEPTMALAYQGFAALKDAAVKHMIIISDGDPSDPNPQTVANLTSLGVTISTVAVSAHGPAESDRLKGLVAGGKYYEVNNPKVLPRIFHREARRVSRPLIHEDEKGLPLQVNPVPLISGVNALPDITGFVLTTKKENTLVQVALVSPKPAGEENGTVLAGWQYGLGRAVAFTSDASGTLWTKQWPGQAAYGTLFNHFIRWSMRPAGASGKFTTTFEHSDGQVRVIVSALDQNDEFLNFLTMTGEVVGPDLKNPIPARIEQMAPGRYVGTFPAKDAGSYFVTISPGGGMAPIRAGVDVPYSDEFRDRTTNEVLLGQIAATEPKDGSPGLLIEAPEGGDQIEPLLSVDTFRHDLAKSTSSQDFWHLVVLAASCLFFGDVFVRRVHVHFAWIPPLARRVGDWVLRRQPAPAQPEYIERLRSRKAEVDDRLEQLRAATRFEPAPETPVDLTVLEDATDHAGPPPPKPAGPTIAPQKAEDEGYTERLLKAKKKAWDERKNQ